MGRGAATISYILRRLVSLPLVMFFVTLILFFLLWQMPVEDRAQVYMPSYPGNYTAEQVERLTQSVIKRYGLDQSFPVQYVAWLRSLSSGDWGYSAAWRQPVLEGLLERLPATAELVLFAMFPAVALAVALGTLSAQYRNHLPDYLVRAVAFVGWSFPPFILSIFSLSIFYAWLGWFPPERLSTWATYVVRDQGFHAVTGMYTIDALLNGNLRLFADAVQHLIAPALVLALGQWALLTRIMRTSLVDQLAQDYVTTARAKGLEEARVIRVHARRNALLPVISAGSVAISSLVTMVVVVEIIFNLNGVGRAAAQAILLMDVPVAVGFALFVTLIVVVANLIADILYGIFDPQARLY